MSEACIENYCVFTPRPPSLSSASHSGKCPDASIQAPHNGPDDSIRNGTVRGVQLRHVACRHLRLPIKEAPLVGVPHSTQIQ